MQMLKSYFNFITRQSRQRIDNKLMFLLYHIICHWMIRRNNFNLDSISLQQLLDYFLVFRIFIHYRDVKALMSIDNILSYKLSNRINLKIKQCASLHSFNQIISSNHYRLHCFWRKHVHAIYVNLFKKCRHSSKMQDFFLFVELSSLTIIIVNDISFTILI